MLRAKNKQIEHIVVDVAASVVRRFSYARCQERYGNVVIYVRKYLCPL